MVTVLTPRLLCSLVYLGSLISLVQVVQTNILVTLVQTNLVFLGSLIPQVQPTISGTPRILLVHSPLVNPALPEPLEHFYSYFYFYIYKPQLWHNSAVASSQPSTLQGLSQIYSPAKFFLPWPLPMLHHPHHHHHLNHRHRPHHHHHPRHDADNCEPKILILCVLLRCLSLLLLLPLSGFTLIFVVIIIGIVIIIFIVIIVSQGTIIIFIKALAWRSPIG